MTEVSSYSVSSHNDEDNDSGCPSNSLTNSKDISKDKGGKGNLLNTTTKASRARQVPSKTPHFKKAERVCPSRKTVPVKVGVEGKAGAMETIRKVAAAAPVGKEGIRKEETGNGGKAGGRRKAVSTPTKDDLTLSDMTLDASCISTHSHDVTMPAPIARGIGGAGMGARSSRRGRAAPTPTRTNIQLKQPLLPQRKSQSLNKTKSLTKDLEDDEITDEMLDDAYAKYLQAHYAAVKSKENQEKIKAKCDLELFEAFTAVETLRKSVIEQERENMVCKLLTKLNRSLTMVQTHLSPALEVLHTLESQLEGVARGVQRVQHHLVIKGVTVADQDRAEEELDLVSSQLKELLSNSVNCDTLVISRQPHLQSMAEQMSQVVDSYMRSIHLIKECRSLVSEGESLSSQEASVALSLHQLDKANKKQGS